MKPGECDKVKFRQVIRYRPAKAENLKEQHNAVTIKKPSDNQSRSNESFA